MMDNKDQSKGKVEQAIADLTGDKDLKKTGKADQRAGDTKAFLTNTKDKLENLVDKVNDKAKETMTKH